ncbi:MAG: MFS transporter [Anaerolineae bacterium]|nr:MFS transporter [Anaerolineae bacterium]MDW8100711.1 MFS transporter [Anaerolineae bacterium]
MTQHGIVLLLMGPVLPSVIEAFQISESAAGLMLGMGSLGFTLGPMAAGTIADRAGARWILLSGLAAEVILLGAFGFIPSFLLALFTYLALSFAAAFVETAVNVIPALIERQQAGSLMNRVHLFFSIGAFICPFLAGLILKATGDWRPVFWLTALPTALLLLLALRVTFPPLPVGSGALEKPVVPLATLLRDRSILLGALALFLYVGAEIGASNWIVLYLQRELGFATLVATSGLSILWIGIMVGRYLNSLLAKRHSSRELVLWAGIGGLATCLALLTARTPAAAYTWLGMIGLCMSGVYPNIMAELNGRDPARAGAVTGFLTVAAAAGAMIFQPLLGVVAQWLSLPAAIAIPGVLMGLLAVAYLGAYEPRPLALK